MTHTIDDVRLTPQSEATLLVEEDGLLITTGEATGDQIDFVQQERERRIFDLTGSKPDGSASR